MGKRKTKQLTTDWDDIDVDEEGDRSPVPDEHGSVSLHHKAPAPVRSDAKAKKENVAPRRSRKI